MIPHKFRVNDRVKHFEHKDVHGTIVSLTTLNDVVHGDCDDEEKNLPWYKVKWDHGRFVGQESECSLLPE